MIFYLRLVRNFLNTVEIQYLNLNIYSTPM